VDRCSRKKDIERKLPLKLKLASIKQSVTDVMRTFTAPTDIYLIYECRRRVALIVVRVELASLA